MKNDKKSTTGFTIVDDVACGRVLVTEALSTGRGVAPSAAAGNTASTTPPDEVVVRNAARLKRIASIALSTDSEDSEATEGNPGEAAGAGE